MVWGPHMVGFRLLLAIGEGALVWAALLAILRRHPGASAAGNAIALPALALALLLQYLDLARPSALPFALPHANLQSPLALAAILAVALIAMGVAARLGGATSRRVSAFLTLSVFVAAHAVAAAVVRDDTMVRGLRVMGPRFAIAALFAGAAAIALVRVGSLPWRAPGGEGARERDFLALAMMASGALWSVGTVRWVSRLFAAGPASRAELWSLLDGRHAVTFWLMASCIAVAPPLLVLWRSRLAVTVAAAWVLTAVALDSWIGVIVPLEFPVLPTPPLGQVTVPAEVGAAAPVMAAVVLVGSRLRSRPGVSCVD